MEPTKEIGTAKTIYCAPIQHIYLEVTDNNRIYFGFTNSVLMGNTIVEIHNIIKDVGGDKSKMNIVKRKLNHLSQVKEIVCIVKSW